MPSKNAERLEKYKGKMRAAGFKRLSVWVCPEFAAMLAAERNPHECGGRTLERLLLGEARKRPLYWAEGERGFPDQYAQAHECGNSAHIAQMRA
ncbi:hypothetical protein V4890_05420 [Ralstonia solanacearum species complex bacterium KE056]|uniref:hypothetical protein n=1 Tax=Ralstonia solanacearum species complex bacterium KE056 TaxID=3119585 RepID=UPI002FC3083D